jgi:hypothetical protein
MLGAMHRLLLIGAVSTLLSTTAHADECSGAAAVERVAEIRCTAQLLGTEQLTKDLSAWTRPKKMAGGQAATFKAGDYRVSGAIECSTSGRADEKKFTWGFALDLTRKGTTLQHATARNLMLRTRTAAEPVLLESYAYLQPPVVIAGVSFTRIDFRCELAVKN